MSGGTHPSQRVHYMEPWPQELEKPDTSALRQLWHTAWPLSLITGVSEASNTGGHPIHVVDGLTSSLLTESKVARCTNERVRPSFHREGRPSFLRRKRKLRSLSHQPTDRGNPHCGVAVKASSESLGHSDCDFETLHWHVFSLNGLYSITPVRSTPRQWWIT